MIGIGIGIPGRCSYNRINTKETCLDYIIHMRTYFPVKRTIVAEGTVHDLTVWGPTIKHMYIKG